MGHSHHTLAQRKRLAASHHAHALVVKVVVCVAQTRDLGDQTALVAPREALSSGLEAHPTAISVASPCGNHTQFAV